MDKIKPPKMNYKVEKQYLGVVGDFILLVFYALLLGVLIYIDAGWVSKVITIVSIIALTIDFFIDIQMLCIKAYNHGRNTAINEMIEINNRAWAK